MGSRERKKEEVRRKKEEVRKPVDGTRFLVLPSSLSPPG
jgi:hypothetical protein